MKNLLIFIAKTAGVFFFLSSLISCGTNDDMLAVINPVLIGKGDLSSSEGIPQQNMVISDTVAWNQLKSKMDSVNNVTGTFTETEIDFSNYLILAAFSEVRPSSGYSIEIKNIVEYSANITATIENVYPSGVVLPVLTQPYHVVKIPKSNKQIVFN